MARRLWQDWVMMAAAAWLFASPFVLGFASMDHPGAWAAAVLSILLFASATEALVVPDAIEDWVDIAIGVGMAGSPWILGFSNEGAASASFLAVGFVVTICAILALARDMSAEAKEHGPAHS